MRLVMACVAAVAAAGFFSTAAMAYDAARQFSGTVNTKHRTWSYRYSASGERDGNYALLSNILVSDGDWHDASENPVTLNYWTNPGPDYPDISANQSGGQLHRNYCCGNVYLDSDSVLVDPGTQIAVLSFLVPKNGRAIVRYSFAHLDCHGGNGINWYVQLNGTDKAASPAPLKSTACDGDGSSGPQKLVLRNVVAGDRINFVVDNNGDYSYDTSEIKAKITIR